MSIIIGCTRQFLEDLNIRWPDPHPVTGEKFTDVIDFSIEPQYDDVRWFRPAYPDRRVPTDWAYDEDGDEWPIEWRELTDEEWDAALESWRKADAEWMKTTGHMRIKSGPDIVNGRFKCLLGEAEGVYVDGKWHWTEWTCRAT